MLKNHNDRLDGKMRLKTKDDAHVEDRFITDLMNRINPASINLLKKKTKQYGFGWTFSRSMNIVFARLLRIHDLRNLIYIKPFPPKSVEFPMVKAKIDHVEYAWVPREDDSKILALDCSLINKTIIEKFRSKDSKCFGAFIKDRLIGFIWVHFWEFELSDLDYTLKMNVDEAYFGPDYVAPEFRGKRLHAALLRNVTLPLIEENYRFGYGGVYVKNLSSRKSIEREGAKSLRYLRTIKFGRYTVYKLPATQPGPFPARYKCILGFSSTRYFNYFIPVRPVSYQCQRSGKSPF